MIFGNKKNAKQISINKKINYEKKYHIEIWDLLMQINGKLF